MTPCGKASGFASAGKKRVTATPKSKMKVYVIPKPKIKVKVTPKQFRPTV